MPDRQIVHLHVAPNPPGDDIRLPSGPWAITELHSPEDFLECVPGRSPGVVVFQPDRHVFTPERIESLVAAAPGTLWIALVKPGDRTDPGISRLIAEVCHDFHTWPCEHERLRITIGHALGIAAYRAEQQARVGRQPPPGLVAASPQMQEVLRMVGKFARVNASVLTVGESGTGKELVARTLHSQSARSNRPFVAVNCAALPTSLVHSELFGHERGAFTGATSRRIGRIEAAAGGTVLLDEIGDLPLEMQAHLLRFLQEGTIERLGSDVTHRVDVRVIAATHVDLEAAIRNGRFREDLYYRLNVLHMEIPPLRERREDVEPLAHHCFERFRNDCTPRVRGIGRPAIEAMERYPWPGNIRELVNRMRRAMVTAEGRLISSVDLGLERRTGPRRERTLAVARREAERAAILASLRAVQGNMTSAAERLGVSRVTLYRLMERHDLRGAEGEVVSG